MAEARRRDEWDRWSLSLAMFFNAHRGEGDEARRPADFHPFERRPAPKPPKVSIRTLKSHFVDRKGR